MTNAFEPTAPPVATLIGGPVVRIDPGTTVTEAARVLVDNEIGAVVVARGDEILGIVSERDVTRLVAGAGDPTVTTASEIAHRELVWCDADAPIGDVASEMMDNWVRHVLVESAGTLVGVVSARDLLAVYAAG